MSCFVYFVQAGGATGAIKIGYSVDVEKRIESLRTGNHLPLRLLAKIGLGDDAAALEKELHVAFADVRLEGEWFKCSPQLLRLIELVGSSTRREYKCSWCDCIYIDHGGETAAMTSRHRQVMAALAVSTWPEADRLICAGGARVVSENPSWAGQECGDAAVRGALCEGLLVLTAEHVIYAWQIRRAIEEAKR